MKIFEVFQCRRLGEDVSVLMHDYGVVCDNAEYEHIWMASVFLAVLISLGFPIVLLVVLVTRYRHATGIHRKTKINEDRGSENNPSSVHASALEYESADAVTKLLVSEDVFLSSQFFVEDYKMQFYWFEPIDL
eukprot:SAG31_NODE_27159_length_430_cov_1.087613_1_plen_132_part_01